MGVCLRVLGLAGCRLAILAILVAGGWVSGALCAAGVLAVDAYFLCAEGGFAAVAGTAHSHADWLRYTG